MKKIALEAKELAPNKFYSSGLYREPFYKKHHLYMEDINIEDVYYNRELLLEVWSEDEEDIKGEDEYEKEDRLFEQVEQDFWENLSFYNTYYEPIIFDERIALECGLTPFTYDDKELLALSGGGMDLSPKLDAYQVLTQRKIDPDSEFFSVNNQDYFRSVIGDEIMNKMTKILKEER